ncbi:MAG: polyphosphate kinase 1 [Planctomycetes bacterium]|nr:polyphosphate kinase 1 [Planctomycetota bacterium]
MSKKTAERSRHDKSHGADPADDPADESSAKSHHQEGEPAHGDKTGTAVDPAAAPILPEHFVNRELSWLEFNSRVLEEAEDETNPLLERLKFLSIFSSNLDEFMMVRVSGVRSQMQGIADPEDQLPERLTSQEQFDLVHARTHDLVNRQYRCFRDEVLPKLSAQGISLVVPDKLSDAQKAFIDEYFQNTVSPVLTPMAIDPSHPTPHLRSRGLYIAAIIEQKTYRPGAPKKLLAVVQLPTVLPRLIRFPGDSDQYILLEQVVASRLAQLFGGFEITCWRTMRITRDSDLDIDGDQELRDLSEAVEEGLKALRHREVVRLELAAGTNEKLLEQIRRPMNILPQELYEIDGPLDLTVFMDWYSSLDRYSKLRDEPFVPRRPVGMEEGADVFATIRKRDVLVHHPYESFQCVVDFLTAAAEDPDVLAIKQTLYRAGNESPIVRALINAAEKGKNVTAVVELLARFDESSNVRWARQMERAGVHVVYGFVKLKTHCKVTLVVRREPEKLRRYVHLGTGNYNSATARIYTDFGLFTCRRKFGEDASALFNFLTGYSSGHAWQRFTISPDDLEPKIISLIDREAERARSGQGGRIIAKLNALVDSHVIESLYRASQAGVKIDLLVRGSCCLRPGIPGISETIRVVSILDRFLEHSRVYVFGAGDDPDVYLASADWMPRNFRRRVELMFPLTEPHLKQRVVQGILPTLLTDNVKAREMQADGTYHRVTRGPNDKPLRAQLRFLTDPQVIAFDRHIENR